MLEHWYETMELATMKHEAILRDMQNMRKYKMKKEEVRHSALSIYVFGSLGKAFSTIGDSLQSHYHFEHDHDKRHMKKVS